MYNIDNIQVLHNPLFKRKAQSTKVTVLEMHIFIQVKCATVVVQDGKNSHK